MAYRTITITLANGQTIEKRIDERGIVPAGGTTGQSLKKQSDTDFDVDWSADGADFVEGNGIAIVDASPDRIIELGGTIAEPITVGVDENASILFGDVSHANISVSRGATMWAVNFQAVNGAKNAAVVTSYNPGTGQCLVTFSASNNGLNATVILDEGGYRYAGVSHADLVARNVGNDLWIPDRKYVDDAVAGSGGGETYAAGYKINITPASPNDLIELDIDSDIVDALEGANAPTAANPFATTDELPGVSTTSTQGIVELATDAETQTGTDTERAITPANLSARTATTSRTGIVELATDAETQTGTDTARAITPANLTARTATTSRTGIAELATQAETDAGTDDARIVTPLKLRTTPKITITVGIDTLFNPTDGTSYYFGINSGVGSSSTTDQQFCAGVAGTITFASITWFTAGTASSNENISIYIRKNGVATLIETIGDTNATKHFTTALNIPVSATDLIAFRIISPTWATNPTNVRISGYITIN